jgi:hypothetical protein
MDRTSTHHRQSFEAPGQEARELTEAELNFVSGGATATTTTVRSHDLVCTKTVDLASVN